ncbi:PilN domain-containing protein [Vibrio profundum]|uniref:PilN domain-containing protein n=1 Tax=Vibrio profundum TaxID=2910247 RepID=UPI003D11BC83
MSSINFLPWRDHLRRHRRRRFYGGCLIGLAIGLLGHLVGGRYLNGQLVIQERRVDGLKHTLQAMNTRLDHYAQTKREMQRQHALVTELDKVAWQQKRMLVLMNLLPIAIPQGVYINEIDLRGDQVRLTGNILDSKKLNLALQRLNVNEHASQAKIGGLAAQKGVKPIGERFTLSFSLKVNRHGG